MTKWFLLLGAIFGPLCIVFGFSPWMQAHGKPFEGYNVAVGGAVMLSMVLVNVVIQIAELRKLSRHGQDKR